MDGIKLSNKDAPRLTVSGGAINRKKVYTTGYNDGYKVGESEGEQKGYLTGKEEGYAEGYNEGEKDGFDKGLSDGEEIGYGRGYTAGRIEGIEEGKEVGIEEGKQAQYDLFWDKFQKNGTRTDYQYAFANWVASEKIFKPKYDIKPVGGAQRMFHGFQTSVSLPNVCEECGIVMDFSKVTSFEYFMYNYCAISRIGIVDCSSVTNLNRAFLLASSLKIIDKLIVHEGITSYTDCFGGTSKLQNITIEGTIAGTGFSVSSHPELTHDSLMSIINALKDYGGTSTTKTVTLGATNLAKLTAAEKAIATQKGWTLA